jgi:hypothetical protein
MEVRYLDGEHEAVGRHLQLTLSTIGQRMVRDDDHIMLRQDTLAREQFPLRLALRVLLMGGGALPRACVCERGELTIS